MTKKYIEFNELEGKIILFSGRRQRVKQRQKSFVRKCITELKRRQKTFRVAYLDGYVDYTAGVPQPKTSWGERIVATKEHLWVDDCTPLDGSKNETL